MRPSPRALPRSPAALHPRPVGSSPSPAPPSPPPHLLHCAPLPTASSLSPSPWPPPTRPLWGPRASPGPGGEQSREPAEGLGQHQHQRRFLRGRPVEARGAPGRMQRGGLGQGCVCGMPRGFSTLGPMPDLAVTAPRCADRLLRGPGFHQVHTPVTIIRATGQHARLLLPPHRHHPRSGVVTLHPTSAFAAAASDVTRLASPLPRARRWHPHLCHLPRPVCRHHPSLCLHCRDHPHTSPPPCIATSIPTLASGGYRGHRFCTVTTPFTPPLPRRPHFHGHHPLHPSHCHGVDSCRPCNRHEHVAPEVTAAGQHGA